MDLGSPGMGSASLVLTDICRGTAVPSSHPFLAQPATVLPAGAVSACQCRLSSCHIHHGIRAPCACQAAPEGPEGSSPMVTAQTC